MPPCGWSTLTAGGGDGEGARLGAAAWGGGRGCVLRRLRNVVMLCVLLPGSVRAGRVVLFSTGQGVSTGRGCPPVRVWVWFSSGEGLLVRGING